MERGRSAIVDVLSGDGGLDCLPFRDDTGCDALHQKALRCVVVLRSMDEDRQFHGPFGGLDIDHVGGGMVATKQRPWTVIWI